MATLDARLTTLETQAAPDVPRIVIYEPGEELPELPAEGTVFLLPDNHRQEATHV